MEGIFIAASGGAKQMKKLDIVSNNLANVSTQGFKRDMLLFEERIPPFASHKENQLNEDLPGQWMGLRSAISYVQVTGTLTEFTQGSLVGTDNPLDVALDGDGFFAIETAAGVRYTRNGAFHLDSIGQLVDREGNAVLSRSGDPILIPINTQRITIDQEGSVFGGNDLDNLPLAQLRLVKFSKNTNLVKEGEGLYVNQNAGLYEAPLGELKVIQGFIEMSNVNPIEEMIQMIDTVRTLEAYQKVIQSIDEANDQSVNNLGRVA